MKTLQPEIIQGLARRLTNVLLAAAVVFTLYIMYSVSKSYADLSMTKGMPSTTHRSLGFKARQFYLNDSPLRIISGSMHYFRVVPEYWEDRMLKMKACGLNTLTTYVPWNLHEEYPGQFNFDWMLNIRQYIQLAQKVGLYVILRPGPYICSEWDLGGLPAWLLRDPNMRVRSNYKPYMDAVEQYFKRLFSEIKDLQYSKGGPIIAVQVENEFGPYSNELDHLLFLKSTMENCGVTELFLTSDNHDNLELVAFSEQALPTANFQNFKDGEYLLEVIKKRNQDFPLMVMEFWSGWFDHWGKEHAGLSTEVMVDNLVKILEYGASVNFYMFHGGTNFGFMSGANYSPNRGYQSDTTSYDYDAPLSETGDVTEKYYKAREIIRKLVPTTDILPDIPPNSPKFKYDDVLVTSYFGFEDMLLEVEKVFTLETNDLQTMEMLSLYGNYGQNYGYILYRATVNGLIETNTMLKFSSTPKDRVQVFLNGLSVCESDWWVPGDTLTLRTDGVTFSDSNQLDLLVENHGRVNYAAHGSGRFEKERKGISGQVKLGDKALNNWKVFPLDFRKPFLQKIMGSTSWKEISNYEDESHGPGLFRASLTIPGQPQDTFLQMANWGKGIVFINDFNLGRYWRKGPQQTLYLPAPLLKSGENSIVIFEHFSPGSLIMFQDKPTLDQVG